MNKTALSHAAIFWLLAMTCAQSADLAVNPVLVSINGDVTVATSGTSAMPAAEKQALAVGSELATGKKSTAVISVAPGLSAAMKEVTVIRLKAAVAGKSERLGELELVQGRVQCRLEKQGAAAQKFLLHTGNGEWTEAVGTLWQSGNENSKRHLAVVDGTVVWNSLPYVKEVSVPAGSVLISEYKMVNGVATLALAYAVNLVDGTTILYYPLSGTEPEVTQATADQLKEARDLFSDALGNQLENLRADNPIFGLINGTLANAGLGGLGPVGGGGPPVGPPPGGGFGKGLGTSAINP
jgi:sirohydrochlorin ferrochelatase